MNASKSYSSRFVAAASALMLSLVLFTNTISLPTQSAPVNLASAYVGAIA